MRNMLKTKKPLFQVVFSLCSGNWTRTSDLRVMSHYRAPTKIAQIAVNSRVYKGFEKYEYQRKPSKIKLFCTYSVPLFDFLFYI